jgi:hypothetical protein
MYSPSPVLDLFIIFLRGLAQTQNQGHSEIYEHEVDALLNAAGPLLQLSLLERQFCDQFLEKEPPAHGNKWTQVYPLI